MKRFKLEKLQRHRDFGLLVARLGLGVMFILHGYPKMLGGPESWQGLGKAMGYVGVDFLPAFWGFAAAFAELVGGALLILGWFFRPACLLLTLTMAVAATMHLRSGDGLAAASHAIEVGAVFFGLLFVGPGKHSVDQR
ncbi:MAG: DoxX family protein [Acidobacteriota bacterium]